MRILLSGQKYFGAETLRALLADGRDVVSVVAPAAGLDGRTDRLYAAADAYRIPVIDPASLNRHTVPPDVDLIVCAHSHAFVSEAVRLRTTYGAIGYHPSLLPLHRGRDAVKWAVRMGDRVTGGTVFWLSNKIDGGPIAAQDYCFISPGETARDLWQKKLMPMGLRLLRAVIADVGAGVAVRRPQDESLATWEPSLDPPRLHRPDLVLLGDGSPESLKAAFDLYSPERVFGA